MKKNRSWSRLLYSTLAASLMATAIPMSVGAQGVSVRMEQAVPVQAVEESSEVQQEAKVSREKAMEIAKGIAGSLDGFDEPHASRRTGMMGPYNNEDVWEINWSKRGPQYAHVSVTVDAQTGVIRNYNRHVESEQEVKLPPNVKYTDAIKIAEEFVKKHYGEKMANFELQQREGDEWGKVIRTPHDNYEVRFVEKVNGVPFGTNQLSVQLNGDGKIRHVYYHSMDNVKFAPVQGVLNKEEILKKLSEALDMKLAYQVEGYYPQPGQQGQEPKVFLGYQPTPYLHMIDAKTGEGIDHRGKGLPKDGDLIKVAETKQAEPAKKLAQPLTQEEAMNRIKEFIDLPKEVSISTVRLEEQMGRKIWQFHFEYRTPRYGSGWQGGSIDAETGELLQIDIAHYTREKAAQAAEAENKEPEQKEYKISPEQAKEKALAFVKEQSKDKLHQLYLSPQPSEEPNAFSPFYRFHLERRVGGILFPFHHVSVTVSAETGEIVEYRQNWDWSLKLPEVGQVVEPDQAKEAFLKDVDVVLEYQVIQEKDYHRYGYATKSDEPAEARLVYRVQRDYGGEPSYLDAHTGKWLSLKTGEEVVAKEEKPSIQDLKGHWAEEELKYLLETGVLEAKDGKVAPETEITRGDFIDMLLGVIDGNHRRHYYPGQQPSQPSFKDVPTDHKYSLAVEWAVERGVLEKGSEFRPDDQITREEAASFLVRALGYNKLAQHESMFTMNYEDTGEIKAKGEVAIVTGIGIMNGYEGKFHPDQALTRASAAVTLFKFLEKRMEYRPTIRY
ncbi:YcdB/YcdC domain-containing protein [Ammoniphilus sp. CFH 90114]|uniref:YcdB/YcdC domain-containing protein n=1 Tax=Ammoniphilus sp. CFH 90114 TaxID=2493665 RepID=UPI00100EA4A0|nr:YcdB/YcdC domain-containing protein [Ammoniphilus sp. CFH 90114]RXT04528.1 hypothetical protein EIZ39_20135 [Ammoniphilus sp. CFH 90114]